MSITIIENAIVERLRAVMPEGMVKRVYTAREVAEIDERSQVSPALFVVYTGLNPGTSLGRGQVQAVTYGFAVIVAVRSAKSTIDGKGQRDEASPIIDAVIENCTGVQLAIPALSLTPLELAPSPASGFSDAGFGYYPIAFNTTRTYRGPTQRR